MFFPSGQQVHTFPASVHAGDQSEIARFLEEGFPVKLECCVVQALSPPIRANTASTGETFGTCRYRRGRLLLINEFFRNGLMWLFPRTTDSDSIESQMSTEHLSYPPIAVILKPSRQTVLTSFANGHPCLLRPDDEGRIPIVARPCKQNHSNLNFAIVSTVSASRLVPRQDRERFAASVRGTVEVDRVGLSLAEFPRGHRIDREHRYVL